MNCLSIISVVTLAFTSTYTLSGKIDGMDTGWVYLKHVQSGELDSAKVTAGNFVFSGAIGSPEYCRIGIDGPSGREFRAGFFLEQGTQRFTAKKTGMAEALISGTPTQDEYRQFEEKEKATKREEQFAVAKDFIKAHPSSYVSPLEIESWFCYDPDPVQLGELYNGLDDSIKVSFSGKAVKDVLDAAIKTSVGKPAPLFRQNDVNDKPVELASFKGQYVLVDFWASWCGPCRAENPALVKAFHAYHSKGFTVLGVSLDDNKKSWFAAVKKDGLNWTQVSDLQGWKNSAALEYGIMGIPMNFLLDKDGIIVARGLRGDELEKKLAELLH